MHNDFISEHEFQTTTILFWLVWLSWWWCRCCNHLWVSDV